MVWAGLRLAAAARESSDRGLAWVALVLIALTDAFCLAAAADAWGVLPFDFPFYVSAAAIAAATLNAFSAGNVMLARLGARRGRWTSPRFGQLMKPVDEVAEAEWMDWRGSVVGRFLRGVKRKHMTREERLVTREFEERRRVRQQVMKEMAKASQPRPNEDQRARRRPPDGQARSR
jgi:hypothetical protein